MRDGNPIVINVPYCLNEYVVKSDRKCLSLLKCTHTRAPINNAHVCFQLMFVYTPSTNAARLYKLQD